MPDKKKRTLRTRACGKGFRYFEQCYGARAIVISTIVNPITVHDHAHTEVIVVRADRYVFFLQYGIASFNHGDNVLRAGGLRFNAHREAHLLVWTKLKCRYRITGNRAVEDSGPIGLLALKQSVDHR